MDELQDAQMMNTTSESTMLILDRGLSAFAHFMLDEAGASPTEFLLVGSLAVTLLTLLALAFDQTVLYKKV